MFSVIVFLFIFQAGIAFHINNVCPSWIDYWARPINPHCYYNNDSVITLPQICDKYGYPVEEHTVTTKDGYNLGLVHLKSPKKGKTILIMHGIYQNCLSWYLEGKQSFAFVLYDAGFDVWTGNLRGGQFSSHINYTTDDPEFWDYGLHEHGIYDVQAVVQYIYTQTGNNKLTYIGFSMGTTSAFIYASKLPHEAETYVDQMIMMAPVMFLRHMRSILAELMVLWDPVKMTLLRNTHYIWKPSPAQTELKSIAFLSTPLNMDLFRTIMCSVMGWDWDQFNPSNLPILILRAGDTICVNVLQNFVDIYRSDVFAALDYRNVTKNRAHYGSDFAPVYNTSDISVPITLIFSANDAIANPTDVLKAYNSIPNQGKNCLSEIPAPLHGHQDFVLGLDEPTLFYKPLIESLNTGQCIKWA